MSNELSKINSDLRNKQKVLYLLKEIKETLNTLPDVSKEHPLTFMHVCGSHEDTLMKNGLRYLLTGELGNRIRMVAGPGCPVCVSPVEDIDFSIAITELTDTIITSFGDMIRVPGTTKSLEMQKMKGKQVITVYSITDALKIAKNNPQSKIIFISPGFETTTPATAVELQNIPPENFFVLSSHRLVPPALEVLMTLPELHLDGFILPGHVSVITGIKAYSEFLNNWHKPCAISGFEPVDMLKGILSLVKQIKDNKPVISNEYTRAVTYEGNIRAQQSISEVFSVVDASWRGLGVFKNSGLEVSKKYEAYNARKEFEGQIELGPIREIPKGCQCHRVIIGAIEPEECPLYKTRCTPEQPVGPCMVGLEGTCRINAIYF